MEPILNFGMKVLACYNNNNTYIKKEGCYQGIFLAGWWDFFPLFLKKKANRLYRFQVSAFYLNCIERNQFVTFCVCPKVRRHCAGRASAPQIVCCFMVVCFLMLFLSLFSSLLFMNTDGMAAAGADQNLSPKNKKSPSSKVSL